MNYRWYINRLKVMGPAEIVKRLAEYSAIFYSRVKFRDPSKWPYHRFDCGNGKLVLEQLPAYANTFNHRSIRIFSCAVDVSKPIDWQGSNIPKMRWPVKHWSAINYRPGNPFGDIRINWEINRLQFLPHLSLTDPKLAVDILRSWLRNNPYLHGPAYVSTMEVALRWISIYRSVCLMNRHIDNALRKEVAGLAVASGKYILSRLSSHSSAGNHLIVEAVGLFWLGKAISNVSLGKKWCVKARKILWQQIPVQINPDGTGKEQSFWYLGFILDAVFHYFLLEDRARIPSAFLSRIEQALEFVDATILPNGSCFDFGDRDDGYVFRADEKYQESFFNGLLDIGSYYFHRPKWRRCPQRSKGRIGFWFSGDTVNSKCSNQPSKSSATIQPEPYLKTFPQGGMTLMKWGRAQALFRHSPLGFGKTCAHGHADALSLLMSYGKTPILVDLGSGQYNGNQDIRNFFRSTAAHNTIELSDMSQAKIAGPFLWNQPYKSKLLYTRCDSGLVVEASHDGYLKTLNTVHFRKIVWKLPNELDVIDSFEGPGGITMKGAFHLGPCLSVTFNRNKMNAEFSDFIFSILFPEDFHLEIFRGSKSPFTGWCSTTYGDWKPNYTVTFASVLKNKYSYKIKLKIDNQLS